MTNKQLPDLTVKQHMKIVTVDRYIAVHRPLDMTDQQLPHLATLWHQVIINVTVALVYKSVNKPHQNIHS